MEKLDIDILKLEDCRTAEEIDLFVENAFKNINQDKPNKKQANPFVNALFNQIKELRKECSTQKEFKEKLKEYKEKLGLCDKSK